jgi:UDP-glucose 4-epimerase
MAGTELQPAYNIGTGTGHSVANVMKVIAHQTGIDFEAERVARRPGDPAVVVASGELAQRDLEWNPSTSLEDMVMSAWDAFQKNYAG